MLDTSNYTGTEQYHKLTLCAPVKCTDGVAYVAETAQAYWLIDAIASWQHDPKVKAQDFQVWKLDKKSDNSCTLICSDGNENEIARQEIEYTDFPDSQTEIWLIDGVMLLPSEY